MNFERNLESPKTLFEDQTADISVPVSTIAEGARINEIPETARWYLAKPQSNQAKHFNKKRRVGDRKLMTS